MPYNITWEPNGVYWTYSGNVTGQEIISTSTSIYGDPRFDSISYKLVDFLNLQSIEMDEKDVEIIAYQHKAAALSNPRIKTALVITPKLDKLAKKFLSIFDDSTWKVRIFHDLNTANHWLDRHAPV